MSHALLSPSAAERWLNCTAAPHFEAQFPSTSSTYADAGTLAHKIAELKLTKKFKPMGPRTYAAALKKLKADPLYAPDMDKSTDTYVDNINEVYMQHLTPPSILDTEVRVDISEYVPECSGTCDCVMISGDTLHIFDYKNGKGVPVVAEGNAQMRLYALGVLRREPPVKKGTAWYFPIIGDSVKTVHMTIIQPNVRDEPSSETLPVDELRAWGDSIKPAAQKAFSGFGEFVSGDHCQFCRGKVQCSARAGAHTALEDFKDCLLPTPENIAQEFTGGPLKPILTHAEIGDLLVRGKNLVAWYSALEEFALSEILKGVDVLGWKAVAGRSNRAFSNQDAALAAIIASGYDEALIYERKAKTLSSLEELMGKKEFAEKLGAYVIKPLGKPTLALLSDKREPYNSALSDFAGVSAPEVSE